MPNNRILGSEGTVRGSVDSPANAPGPSLNAGAQATTPEETAQREKKLQFVAAELKRMRYFRRQYDIRRAHFYRQYLSQRDDRFYPDNVTKRSNVFFPYPFSNVENIVARVVDAFFSMDEWFEVSDKPPYSDEDSADIMQMTLVDKLHQSRLVSQMELLIRNIVVYGESGIKVDWDFGFETVLDKQPQYVQAPDPMTGQMTPVPGPDGQPMIQGYQAVEKQVPKNRPRITVIDVYDLLVDPDGAYKAHLTERTWRNLKEEYSANPEMYFADGMKQLESRLANEEDPDEIVIRLAEFWNENDNTWTIMTFGEDSEGISFKDLRASFRATSYSPFKRRIYGGETIMLFDGQNPFAHKRCPILETSFIKIPNEVFGLGVIEVTSDTSEALNRFVNMIFDNWNLGINHRFAFDINAEIDHDSLNSFNTPGGKVGVVGDPSKAIFPLPAFTPGAQDYQVLEVARGMIEMASGISDFYDRGMGGSKGNKTATGIAQISQETNYRMKGFIRNLELDILQPILEMCASMVQQFIKEPFSVSNPSAPQDQPQSVMVQPEQLIGTYAYSIVAANYAQNQATQQRNLMALANIIAPSPYVDQYQALRELLKAFKIKHIDRIMKTPEQVQMEQQQQMQQQMMMMQMQHQMEMEKEVAVAEASPTPVQVKGPEGSKGPGSGHGSNRHRNRGKKPKMQHEGAIPGAGITGPARSEGQQHGANAMGLGGLGEVPLAG